MPVRTSLARKQSEVHSIMGRHLPACCVDKVHEGVRVMKKILLLIATAAGVLAIQKKLKDQQAEQDLWAEATDEV